MNSEPGHHTEPTAHHRPLVTPPQGVEKTSKQRGGVLQVGEGESAQCFERRFVHSVYDQIAAHFAHTRYKPWPGVRAFLTAQPLGSVVLEVGCGNGRNLWANQNVVVVGCDVSAPLLAYAALTAKEKPIPSSLVQCDCLALPFLPGTFTACMIIAVLHHLALPERRLRALQEIRNVLAPGSLVLVTVWGFEDNEKSFGLTNQDASIRWQTEPQHMEKKEPGVLPDSEVYSRYYHFFKAGELSALCLAAGLVVLPQAVAGPLVVQGEWSADGLECRDHGNWVVVAQKPLEE